MQRRRRPLVAPATGEWIVSSILLYVYQLLFLLLLLLLLRRRLHLYPSKVETLIMQSD